jgi:hypothetical protein
MSSPSPAPSRTYTRSVSPDDDLVILTIPMGFSLPTTQFPLESPPDTPTSTSSLPPLLSPQQLTLNLMLAIPPLSSTDLDKYHAITLSPDYSYKPAMYRNAYINLEGIAKELLGITRSFHALVYGREDNRTMHLHTGWMLSEGLYRGKELIVEEYIEKRGAPLTIFHVIILHKHSQSEFSQDSNNRLPGSSILNLFDLDLPLSVFNAKKIYSISEWIPFIQ